MKRWKTRCYQCGKTFRYFYRTRRGKMVQPPLLASRRETFACKDCMKPKLRRATPLATPPGAG